MEDRKCEHLTKKEYIAEINKMMKRTDDEVLLHFIYNLMGKAEARKNEKK